jgi:hypothetical protein
MKGYKYFLLGTVVAATILPFSLTATDNVKDDERSHYAPRAHAKVAPAPVVEEKGWFSSTFQKASTAFYQKAEEVRQTAAKGLKTAGRALQKGDDGSAAGAVTQTAFSAAWSWCGLPNIDALQEGARKVAGGVLVKGAQLFGAKKGETDIRVENSKLRQSSTASQIEADLRKNAQELRALDKETAFEKLQKYAARLEESGFISKKQLQEIDVHGIYIREVVEDFCKNNATLTLNDCNKAVKVEAFDALEGEKNIKAAPFKDKMNLINQRIEETYKKARKVQDFNNRRNLVISAPAA